MAAAGAIVESLSKTRSVRSLTLAWTSSAGGAVQEIPAGPVSGEIQRVVFAPGAGGVQPSDNYDVTLLDEDGFDVLAGLGANRSNATKQQLVPLTGDGTTTNQRIVVDGTLTLTVANAGSAKTGTVTVYFR